jgi:nucleotide-binding universal stress UspA family protein
MQEPAMSESIERRYVIVVAVDLSSISEAVIEHALDMAGRHARVHVHAVTVVPAVSGFLRPRARAAEDTAAELAEAESALRERLIETASVFLRQSAESLDWRLRTHARAGHPAEEITALSDEVEADLIVLGQHGWSGRRHRLVGSVSECVSRMAHCSVLLVQPAAHEARAGAPEPQCPACVVTRRSSDGEDWFCERHRDDHRDRALTVLLPWSELSTRPGGIY